MRLAIRAIALLLLFVTGTILSIPGHGGGESCTIIAYLGSFKIVEEGSKSAGDQWIWEAEINGSLVAKWDYIKGFTQNPFIYTSRASTIQLGIKASVTEDDNFPDKGEREEVIEFECPFLKDSPIRKTLEVTVVEDRGPKGRVESYYTTWQFEFVVEPLLVQYH